MLEIYTDGSSTGKVGDGGWSFVVLNDNDLLFESYGGAKETTNNRMELSAVIESLRYTYKHYPKNVFFTVYCDSQYVVKGLTEWFSKWEQKINDGKEIKNQDLWIDCWALLNEFSNIQIQWVRGHSGLQYNDRCDKLAKLGKLQMKDINNDL